MVEEQVLVNDQEVDRCAVQSTERNNTRPGGNNTEFSHVTRSYPEFWLERCNSRSCISYLLLAIPETGAKEAKGLNEPQ